MSDSEVLFLPQSFLKVNISTLNLTCLSGTQMGSNHEKNRDRKPRDKLDTYSYTVRDSFGPAPWRKIDEKPARNGVPFYAIINVSF